jgi:hypothetical protein
MNEVNEREAKASVPSNRTGLFFLAIYSQSDKELIQLAVQIFIPYLI